MSGNSAHSGRVWGDVDSLWQRFTQLHSQQDSVISLNPDPNHYPNYHPEPAEVSQEAVLTTEAFWET